MTSKFIPPKNIKVEDVPKAPRSIEAIQQEYMQKAAELGNITYQLATLDIQKQTVLKIMSELNLEASTVKAEGEQNG